jgi:pimeloyl-ACP methyl ester carboxylesterase
MRGADPHGVVFFDAGEGDAILFIHGLGGNLTHWQLVAPPLTATNRVIGMDLPGFGLSRRPAEPMSYRFMADTVLDLADRRGVDRFTVVGHSFGGAVATELALRCPERVTGLVVVNPAGYQALPDWMRVGSRVALERWFLTPALFLSVLWILDNVCQAEAPGVDAFRRSSLQLENGMGFLSDMTYAAHALRDDLVNRTYVHRLPGLTLPLHAVWGGADRLLRAEPGLAAASTAPAGRTTLLPGVGHMPIFERPEAVVAAVRDVLARRSGPATSALGADDAPGPERTHLAG